MKPVQSTLLLIVITVLSSCSAVNFVFKAGMWWAFFLVFVVVFVIAWIALKRKK